MKSLTVLTLMVVSIFLSNPGSLTVSSPHQQFNEQLGVANQQLGIEITTNTCTETLYFPVGRTRERGLIATVPVRDGGNVTAVRIMPVMEGRKIRFDAMLLSGSYSETMPRRGLNKLHVIEVMSRVAAAGETRIVSDEANDSPWSVTVRAVALRPQLAASTQKLQVVKTSAQDESAGCGCAYCHDLRVCPNRGSCIETTCGSICCPNGYLDMALLLDQTPSRDFRRSRVNDSLSRDFLKSQEPLFERSVPRGVAGG